MSVNIATLGMFKDCCGRGVGGGGAPPYRRDEAKAPFILVSNVEVVDINIFDKHKIEIKLVDN